MIVTRMWDSLGDRHRRLWIYRSLGIASVVLAILALLVRHDFTLMVSDARGYYAWLPAAVIDHTLDVGPELERRNAQEGPWLGRTPTGLVNDAHPIGVSLTLAPAFLVAHALSHGMYDVTGWDTVIPDGYSVLYQLFSLAFVVGLGVVMMTTIDRIATTRLGIDGSAVGLAVVFYWAGSSFLYYVVRHPLMAHVIGAFWVTCAVAAFEDTRSRWERGGVSARSTAIFALAAGMAIITRPTNVTLAVFGVYLIWISVRDRRWTELALLMAAAPPLLLQIWVWRRTSGAYLYYSYQYESFDWKHAALWQTLISSNHGLFFWTPLLVLSALGLATSRAAGHVVVRLGMVALVGLWVANSAWTPWWFGVSFGGRAFLDLSVFFVLGLAMYFQRRFDQGLRPLEHTLLVSSACVGFTWILMAAFMLKLIPIDDYLLPWL